MLPAAIGFSQSTSAVVAVAGPAIGGVLVAAVGPLPAVVADSATFVASAVLVLTVPRVAPGAHPSGRNRDLLVEGIQTVRGSRRLLGLTGYLGLLSLGLGALNATAPSLMLLTTHLNAGQFGSLEAAQGLGGAAGPHLLHVSWPAAVGPSAGLYPWMAFVGRFVGLLTVTAQTRLLTRCCAASVWCARLAESRPTSPRSRRAHRSASTGAHSTTAASGARERCSTWGPVSRRRPDRAGPAVGAGRSPVTPAA
ncbi:MAG: hypothetical protein M0Z54_03320 [Thermaerobacter sp.]|nr:hypothetical protein [Thermaerobacter sp.]